MSENLLGVTDSEMLPTRYLSGNNDPKTPPQSINRHLAAAPPVIAPRVLIVEDEFLVALHLQELLRELNLTASDIAADSQEAIDRAIDFEPNIVLMDVNLGDGPDGIDVVRRMRELRDVAVIFVTAYTDAHTLGRIKQAVPDALVLAKPPSTRELRLALSNVYPMPQR